MKRTVIYYDEIDSTNEKAKELAKQDAVHGTLLVANKQTAGKGRRGRVWESPAGENIYMSLILKPELEVDKASMLTLVMAYSVALAVEAETNLPVQIKWPNDLVVCGKKICGILTEMSVSQGSIDYVIVGVGINVNSKVFPAELQDKATSLYLESGKQIKREELISQVMEQFEQAYEIFLHKQDLSFLQEAYNYRLVSKDKEVRVLEPGNEYQAIACGINPEGELIVVKENGEQEAIYAGEVSVRGIYGYV